MLVYFIPENAAFKILGNAWNQDAIWTSPGGTQHRRPRNLESRCNLDKAGEIHHLRHEWHIRLPAPTSSAS